MQTAKTARKRALSLLLAAIALTVFALPALAAETTGESDFRIITADPSPVPISQELFPVEIEEYKIDNEWRITKIYELNEGENANGISRAEFDRNGWHFICVDITENKSENTDSKEVTEVTEGESDTKDVAKIIENGIFATTKPYSADGYTGTLKLDPATIKAEVAGTRSSSYNVSATRSYPGLPRNDTSVVPKTTEEKGRTLNLASVDWKSEMTGTDEYGEPLLSWTATAQYSVRVATTVATGYIVTANYVGQVSRTVMGDTIYKVYFEGTPLKAPISESAEGEDMATAGTTTGVKPSGGTQGDQQSSKDSTLIILLFIVVAALAVAVVFLFAKRITESKSKD
jgi:hypothetical protein